MKTLVVLALACAASSVHAATMLIDFGVTAFNTPGWNNFTTATNGSSLALLDSVGGTTSYTLTLGLGDVNVLNDATPVDPAAPPAPFTPTTVARDGFFMTDGRTFTLSGLSAAETYNITLYSYVDRPTTRATTFSIDGTTPITIEPARFPNNGTHDSGETATFTGLVADPSGNIVITVASAAGTNWILNGMQVVSIPEPAAALLGGLGLIPLLRRRRWA